MAGSDNYYNSQEYLNNSLKPGGISAPGFMVGMGEALAQPEAPAPVDNSAAIAAAKRAAALKLQSDPLLASLSSLETILGNKNTQSRSEYQRALDSYNEQDALDKTAYNENVVQNESTYTGNNQAALLNAANASSGLRGVLSSLGALAGSGSDVVQRLVGLAANQDVGASRKTFDANAGNLNQAWGQAERQQRERRSDASALLENNLQNNEATVLSSRQSILQQLANVFGTEDARGQQYASEASALAAPIARTTRATVAPYTKASSSFSPAALQSYLAGTQNLNVSTAGGGGAGQTPINSPIFGTKKKEQLAGVA